MELCENCKAVPVRQLLTLAASGQIKCDKNDIDKILRDCHISQWEHNSRFCGTCGTENPEIIINGQETPHRLCPKCGRQEYPRICPAIIVIITDDNDRILLAHNKKFRKGVYSHISGFNEAGESLEETIVREVWEEVNINIKDIEYVKSQPWPFPNSLMIGYRARYASGTVKPDGAEIIDAQWFTKDILRQFGQPGLPELPAEGSLSRWLIDRWLG
ncbi:MAG: NAD(+) diphosphatase [Treponema sp.]|jgi:NAD+ diphosphatase|nr:NAD(+) diphosphatase [Treponema sp.]